MYVIQKNDVKTTKIRYNLKMKKHRSYFSKLALFDSSISTVYINNGYYFWF